VYSPLICGTLIVIKISVLSLSSRISVSTIAVKSGLLLPGTGGGV
jgi:hypothetical protein